MSSSTSEWKIGDEVELNGIKRKITDYDASLNLYRLDDGMWTGGGNLQKPRSEWNQTYGWKEPVCECGAKFTTFADHHSDYCPKYKKD